MPGAAVAQSAAAVELVRGFEPAARAEILAVLDSARRGGVPEGPLASKVIEGVTKGASHDRIARVVHETFTTMSAARAALGGRSDVGEISAGGAALRAGLAATDLERIRSAAGGRLATEALVVAADLVRRGVPTPDAVRAVIRLTEAGAESSAFMQFQSDVAQDVAAGVAPRSAALERSRVWSSRPHGQPSADDPRPIAPDAGGNAMAQAALSADLGVGLWSSPASRTSASLVRLNAARALSWLTVDASLGAMSAPVGLSPGPARAPLALAHLRGTSTVVEWNGIRGSLAVGLDRDAFDSTFGQGQLSVLPRVAIGRGATTAWLSAGAVRPVASAESPTGLESEAGARFSRGPIVLDLFALRRRSERVASIGQDSVAIDRSSCLLVDGRVRCRQRLSSTSFEGRAMATVWGTDLTARGGVLRGSFPSALEGTQRWAAFQLAIPVRDNLTMMAQVGTEPANVMRMLPMRSSHTLGFRIHAPKARARERAARAGPVRPVELGPADETGHRVVRLSIAARHTVELKGDMTGWRSVRLTRSADGSWELRAHLDPGVHHFVVRVDEGAWGALSGLPSADDGFGETVTVLVVGASD